MESISYDEPCNENKDCESNVCELIYENNKPKGRYCLVDTNNKYSITCETNKDCISGECRPIYDDDGNLVTRKCVKAPKIDKDTAFNSMFGEERSNEYGLMNGKTIQLKVGERGPITEIIIKVFSIIGNLFNIVVFNFDVCSQNRRQCKKREVTPWGSCGKKRRKECNVMTERANHGIIYGIWLSMFEAIFKPIMDKQLGFVWDRLNKKHYNLKTGKCDRKSDSKDKVKSIDLWYVRTLLTILFPPFGIFMSKGFKGIPQMMICCALTLLFYFPGLIYALIVINGSNVENNELNHIQNLKTSTNNKNNKKK